MKHLILTLLALLIFENISGQQVSAKVEKVNGIVVSKYSRHEGFFCEQETRLLCNGEDIFFYQRSSFNVNVIKNNPQFKDVLGDYSSYEYDYLKDFFDRRFTHDLQISKFNFLTQEHGDHEVESLVFYYKNGCDTLYAVYQFSGTVVFYKGLKPLYAKSVIECPCSGIKEDCCYFAVLKEAEAVSQLTRKQEKELGLTPSGIRSISMLYCE
jgi:hypothetical protein